MVQRLGESKITKTFQITMPKKARELLKVSRGDFVIFYLNEKTRKIFIKSAELVPKK